MSLTYIFSSKLVTSVADAIEKQVFALSSQKVYPQLVSIVASNNEGVGAYDGQPPIRSPGVIGNLSSMVQA